MNLNTRKKNGFTMIELIAVIVILGILAAAAVPRFLDARDDARTAAAQGIVAGWLSECSMRVANSALNDADFVCPQLAANPPAGKLAGDGWTLDANAADFAIVMGEATADPCTITVTPTDGAAQTGSFDRPDGI